MSKDKLSTISLIAGIILMVLTCAVSDQFDAFVVPVILIGAVCCIGEDKKK